MFLSAFASLCSDPVSQAHYQRKRDQGKRHTQTVLASAHRRLTHHIGARFVQDASGISIKHVIHTLKSLQIPGH